MKKFLVFNWKMAPDSLKKAGRLFGNYAKISKSELVIAPPFVYLSELKNLKLASQDVFWENKGYYTGEISPKMLKNLGVEYVIIGHSERRKFLGETDEMINKKVLAALKAGLKIILCVGENLSVRRRGKKAIENFIKNQFQKDLNGLSGVNGQGLNVIVAYEPIWAIGTGHSDTPQDAVEMIKYIKQILNSKFHILNSRVLYGGSVSGKNIKNFIEYKEIDGFLIGHASLKLKEVEKIVKASSR